MSDLSPPLLSWQMLSLQLQRSRVLHDVHQGGDVRFSCHSATSSSFSAMIRGRQYVNCIKTPARGSLKLHYLPSTSYPDQLPILSLLHTSSLYLNRADFIIQNKKALQKLPRCPLSTVCSSRLRNLIPNIHFRALLMNSLPTLPWALQGRLSISAFLCHTIHGRPRRIRQNWNKSTGMHSETQ